MPAICYEHTNLGPARLATVAQANAIIADYAAQGFNLTLRQLYYQFVSRDLIPNNLRSYKNLGETLNAARMAGLIDWDAITDRTRSTRLRTRWNHPETIIDAISGAYHIDYWEGQDRRVEVFIEKDALVEVVESACQEFDVPLLSCRGYVSASTMWECAMRVVGHWEEGEQEVTILHLGDHDPSGIDMTRDIRDRLEKFCAHHDAPAPTVRRLALTRAQITRYNPPPNPAKITDSRAIGYIREHGNESWELDALDPRVIIALVRTAIQLEVDDTDAWNAIAAREAEEKMLLGSVSTHWEDVAALVKAKTG